MSPDHDTGWRIATKLALAEFDKTAKAIGFGFLPEPGSNPLLGRLRPLGDDPSPDPLPALLSLQIFFCCQAGLPEPSLTPDDWLALHITARTAFSCDPGTAFARALAERCAVAAQRLDDLRLCLHEAIANAVIHGNFGIKGGEFVAPEQFLQHAALIDQRLDDETYASRPVHLTAHWTDNRLTMTVLDHGPGFPLPPRIDSLHGLGLISQRCNGFHHDQGGRQVTLHFDKRLDMP